MSETDELHRLLGEAGIEYKVTSCHLCSSTEWECDLGNAVFYEDHTNGYTRVTIHYKDGMTHFQITSDLKPPERYVTPEQAIAATLGRGTCKPTTYDNYLTKRLKPGEYYEFWEPACACSECGELIPIRRFCPNCGARIEVDG